MSEREARSMAAGVLFGAVVLMALPSASSAEPQIKLQYGLKMPQGWADGLTSSLSSWAACQRLLAPMPLDAPARSMTRCLVRVDPDAKPLPMSQSFSFTVSAASKVGLDERMA
jgi:hypothetical protein